MANGVVTIEKPSSTRQGCMRESVMVRMDYDRNEMHLTILEFERHFQIHLQSLDNGFLKKNALKKLEAIKKICEHGIGLLSVIPDTEAEINL